MITIHSPIIESSATSAKLKAEITIDETTTTLWCSVESCYRSWLCSERSDAFLIGLLHYALEFKHDIRCEAPITKRLYDQLTEQFLPEYCRCSRTAPITIIGETASCITPCETTAIGSGVSCGVDSLYEFAVHPEITHGVIFNLYDHNASHTQEEQEDAWVKLRTQARVFCEQINKPLVAIDTNYDKGIIPGLRYEWQTAFANLFLILALQKGFSKYILASGYAIEDSTLSASIHDDTAHYEAFLLPLVSLPHLYIVLGAVDQTRIDKVKTIIHYPVAQKVLNVCWNVTRPGENCTAHCGKCMRTLLEIHAFKAEKNFERVFDLAYFQKHYRVFLLHLYQGWRTKDSYLVELKPYYEHAFRELNFRDKIWILRRLHFSFIRKIRRKCRGVLSHLLKHTVN